MVSNTYTQVPADKQTRSMTERSGFQEFTFGNDHWSNLINHLNDSLGGMDDIISVGEKCFEREKVERVFDEETYEKNDPTLHDAIPSIYLSVNSSRSDNSFVTIGYRDAETGAFVICHTDGSTTKSFDELAAFIEKNLVQFREKYPHFHDTQFIVCSDMVGSFDSDMIISLFTRGTTPFSEGSVIGRKLIDNPLFVREGDGRLGVRTTREMMYRYISQMKIELERGYVRIHENIFNGGGAKDITEKNLSDLECAMKGFEWSAHHTHTRIVPRNEGAGVNLMRLVYLSSRITESD